jgi:hypothetical protein
MDVLISLPFSPHQPPSLTTTSSWNDTAKHTERHRRFNIPEFKRLAAASISRNATDVSHFEKLAEGSFNRTFLITMRDGFQFVGRIPFPVTEPKQLVVASEVATMRFLRSRGLPVPEVYGYSSTAENEAGTEYVFMELVRGTNLGDVWFDLSGKDRMTVIGRLVELESRLFALPFPASGSMYYTKDLPETFRKINISTPEISNNGRFCVGPETRLGMWHAARFGVRAGRGPCTYKPFHLRVSNIYCANAYSSTINLRYKDPDSAVVLAAGAKKEMAYLREFGKPLHPFQRLRRETYLYQKQSPSEHLENLEKYLQIVPHLVPSGNEFLLRPTLRHPDLQPNNIFISDNLEITGIIDWQHSTILPLFLQCGIPNSFQNYGDSVSDSLEPFSLPDEFETLSENKQYEQIMLLRRRQLHYSYVVETEKSNPTHYKALAHDFSILRRKIFDHANSPWEGDNVTLKADLIHLTKNWSSFVKSNSQPNEDTVLSCPITFTQDEIDECLRLNAEHNEADEQLQACRDAIGVGPEGWVPVDQYDEIKERARRLKAAAIEASESKEEREKFCEHWVFDDFDESEYD